MEPVTAEDVAKLAPPPSYEEVMGEYETSVRNQTELPPLAYIDIMPRCMSVGNITEKISPKFAPFSEVIDGANAWLQAHPGLLVWKCETVQRKVTKGQDGGLVYNLQNMLRHDSTYGYQVYVRGIRMWLTKRQENGDASIQKLGLKNVIPAKRNVLIPMRYHGMFAPTMTTSVRVEGSGSSEGNTNQETSQTTITTTGVMGRTFSTFEGLAKTIEILNKDLLTNPLPGKILTVETETIKAGESFSSDLHPEASCWTEDKMKFKRKTQLIRIFYVQGPPAKEEIELQEFQPELIKRGDTLKKPKFEEMSNTFQRMSSSLHGFINQGQRVVNIQQFDTKVNSSFITGEVEIASDSTDDIDSVMGSSHIIKTIRVFLTKSADSSSSMKVISFPAPTSRLFLPLELGPRNVETMVQTMERIESWLKVTGIPIYSVETVELLHQPGLGHSGHQNKADYPLTHNSKHWITGIRLYFPCSFIEPDPALLPAEPKRKSSTCSIM